MGDNKGIVMLDENECAKPRRNPPRAAKIVKVDAYDETTPPEDTQLTMKRCRYSKTSLPNRQGSIDAVALKFKDKVHDSSNGTTCHQCRQKTLDTKTNCTSCNSGTGLFCGPCLKNRYGEDIVDALKNENWKCPSCQGICNCSICRKRAGSFSTGVLIPVARHYGFDNVKDYLNRVRMEYDERMRESSGQNQAG